MADSENPEPRGEETDDGNPRQVATAYRNFCQGAEKVANPLILSCLTGDAAGQYASTGKFIVAAPGSHASVFRSRIDDPHVAILKQVFSPAAGSLQRLDLSYNLIGDEGAGSLADMLSGAASLRALVLRGNHIGAAGCEALCSGLKSAPELRKLDLAQNPLQSVGGRAVAHFLQSNDVLHELDLEDTQLDINALVALAAVLHVNNSTLRVLNVARPSLFTLQEEHLMHFSLMLRVNTGMREVNFGMHSLFDTGVKVLVHYLVENKTLRVLDLRSNQIGWKGAHALAILLEEDCFLTELNLAHNRIGENDESTGAEAIARGLMSNTNLVKLNMDHNQLCGAALLHLAVAVGSNTTIEYVSLFHNKWDQPSSRRFERIFSDQSRLAPLKTDFLPCVVDRHVEIAYNPG